MSKKQKLEITLRFDNPILKSAMSFFFQQYAQQLPLFLRDQAKQVDADADPSMNINMEKSEIVFKMMNKDKGQVFVADGDKVITTDYKLVPNDTGYVSYESGQLAIFFKRGPVSPDVRIGVFPDLKQMVQGLSQVEDPVKVLEKAEAKVEEAKAEHDEAKVVEMTEASK